MSLGLTLLLLLKPVRRVDLLFLLLVHGAFLMIIPFWSGFLPLLSTNPILGLLT